MIEDLVYTVRFRSLYGVIEDCSREISIPSVFFLGVEDCSGEI